MGWDDLKRKFEWLRFFRKGDVCVANAIPGIRIPLITNSGIRCATDAGQF